MLMGRGTYEYFAPTWPSVPGDYARRINQMPKYVFSNTLEKAEWTNCKILRGDVVTAAADQPASEPSKSPPPSSAYCQGAITHGGQVSPPDVGRRASRSARRAARQPAPPVSGAG